MKIQDVFAIYEEKEEAAKQAIQLRQKYDVSLQQYMEQYFNGTIPPDLPVSKNQFISILSNSFKIHKGESGNIYWTATGNVRTVKDGSVSYGHSQKTLYQAEYEAMPLALRKLTVLEAKNDSNPLFPIVNQNYNGTSYANYGYLLAQNEDLGLLLVWRKAGSAYIDRMRGSASAPSSLQLLVKSKTHARKNEIIDSIENEITSDSAKNMALRAHSLGHAEIVEGGKLTKDVIVKNADVINGIFGADTVNNIVTIMESKTKKAKELKEEQVKEEQLAMNVKPSKKMK